MLPNATWWIKADGCDVIASLEESMDLAWNGDVDLGDGECQQLHNEYLLRQSELQHLTLTSLEKDAIKRSVLCLKNVHRGISEDLEFVYERRLSCNNSNATYLNILRAKKYKFGVWKKIKEHLFSEDTPFPWMYSR